MTVQPVVIRSARVAYKALAWGLLVLAILLIVLPGIEMISDLRLSGDLGARSILLGIVALMAGLARVGRFSGRSVAWRAPLVFLVVLGADYLLAATGCDFPAGLHPINAASLMAVSLGLVRTADTWVKEEEA